MIRSRTIPRCATGSRLGWLLLGLILLLPRGLAAGDDTWARTNYYNVTGSTILEIQRSMRRSRPAQVDHEALTEWSIRSRFSTAQIRGEYRCAGFTTTTTVRITLPRWMAPEDVAESVKAEWERYLTALTQHEQGHARFAATAAGALRRRVAEMGTAPDPDSLTSQVEGLISRTIQEFREREREYDRLTRHGLEQGASLLSGAGDTESGSWRKGDREMHHRDRRGGSMIR